MIMMILYGADVSIEPLSNGLVANTSTFLSSYQVGTFVGILDMERSPVAQSPRVIVVLVVQSHFGVSPAIDYID